MGAKIKFHMALLIGGLVIIPISRVLCATNESAILGAPLSVAGPILIVTALCGMALTLVERHVEVTCPDCGAVHQVERGVHSFLCTSCGARVGAIPTGQEKGE